MRRSTASAGSCAADQLKAYEELVRRRRRRGACGFSSHRRCKGDWDLPASVSPAQPAGLWGARSDGPVPPHVRKHLGVVSRYVDRPMLLDGLKFDVRLYVLVSSVHPLVMYLHHGGSRGLPRSPTTHRPSRRCMHLTNYSVNKRSNAFVELF